MEYTPTPYPTQPNRSWAAITSLVLGILNLCGWIIPICGGLFGVLGVIFGILGLKSTQRGLAIAGIVLSALTLLLTIVLTIAGFSLASLGIVDMSNIDLNQWLPQY